MPLTVFDSKGIPAHRRERIEAAVTAGGRHVQGLYEGWIATDPFRGDVRVTITGPHGFERRAAFSTRTQPKSRAVYAKPLMMSSELLDGDAARFETVLWLHIGRQNHAEGNESASARSKPFCSILVFCGFQYWRTTDHGDRACRGRGRGRICCSQLRSYVPRRMLLW